ncbi:MAG: YaaR family protein [Tepidanaerobacteraceae bacterium]|jgi:uncharacterized protein YaaR (DUF327 family)|nr:YaaR family protein [Tepidanaerobacteraceae bacterium]
MKVSLSPEFTLPRDVQSGARGVSRSFEEHLMQIAESNLKERMDGELAAILEQGRRIAKSMSLSDLKKYRNMVANFLKLCIAQGLSCKEERLSPRFGRSKALTIIKTVNQKLLALAEALLSENKDSIKILALTDEIRGLLLDLYA